MAATAAMQAAGVESMTQVAGAFPADHSIELQRPLCLEGMTDAAFCSALGFTVDLDRNQVVRAASLKDIQLRQKCAALPEETRRRFGEVCWVKEKSGYPNWPAYIIDPLTCSLHLRDAWESIPEPKT